MTDELDRMSDDTLSKTFALEVLHARPLVIACKEVRIPPYATSADAVMPHLNKTDAIADRGMVSEAWTVEVYHSEGKVHGYAPTFARAACIAMIRSKRVQKGSHA